MFGSCFFGMHSSFPSGGLLGWYGVPRLSPSLERPRFVSRHHRCHCLIFFCSCLCRLCSSALILYAVYAVCSPWRSELLPTWMDLCVLFQHTWLRVSMGVRSRAAVRGPRQDYHAVASVMRFCCGPLLPRRMAADDEEEEESTSVATRGAPFEGVQRSRTTVTPEVSCGSKTTGPQR